MIESSLDIKTVQRKIQVKQGQVVFSVATEGRAFMVLHSGKVGIEHVAMHGVETKELYMGVVNKNQYFGWETFMPRSDSFPTFRCMTPCELSIYPCASLVSMVKRSPEVFIVMVCLMSQNLDYFVSYNNKIVALINQLVEANFKLSVLFTKLNLTIDNQRLEKYMQLGENEASLLEISNFLSPVADFKGALPRFNPRDTSLLEELYRVSMRKQLIEILENNTNIGELSFDVFISEFAHIYSFIKQNLGKLAAEFKVFAADANSFLQLLYKQREKINLNRWHGLLALAYEHYEARFFTNSLINRLFNVAELHERIFIQKEVSEPQEGLGAELAEDVDEILAYEETRADDGQVFAADELKQTRNLIRRTAVDIFLEKENLEQELDIKEFLSADNFFKYQRPKFPPELWNVLTNDEKLDKSTDAYRKNIRVLNALLMKGFERAACNLYIAKEKNKAAQRLLQYGFLKGSSLKPEQLQSVLAFEDGAETHYEVFTLAQWLQRIVTADEQPSNNELGLDFDKFTKNNERFLSEKARAQLNARSAEEKLQERVAFEVQNMVSSVYKMINFSASSDVVRALSRANLPESMKGATFITRALLGELLDELRSYDHLLFYRDILFRVSKTQNQIIQAEVLPKFIIFPAVGSEVVFWQEVVGTNKQAPARFCLPLIFIGNLRKSLITALGNFRWEINRTVKGVSWMNPVDGGLTGKFIDYLTFYRKSAELSFEAKEKLGKFIRNNRNNPRKMFSTFYYDWIEYERKGLIRLNNEERRLLFSHIPFAKKVRDALTRIPAFQPLINKHNFKAVKGFDRFTKYYARLKDTSGKFPEKVENYLKSLTM